MSKQLRQGDVFLEKVKALPVNSQRLKTRTLALGERTGHSHSVTATANLFKGPSVIFKDGREAVFVVVNADGSQLIHQKHAVADLEPGVYEYTHQREMDYFAGVARNVVD